MKVRAILLAAAAVIGGSGVAWGEVGIGTAADVKVGPVAGDQGAYVVSTKQVVRAAGESVGWHGRPLDLVVGAGGKFVYVKAGKSVLVVDAKDWKIRQELKFPGKSGGSMTGMALAPDGRTVWVTASDSKLLEGKVQADGTLAWGRKIDLPPVGLPKDVRRHDSLPCGVAISADAKWALVCHSMDNTLAEVDLEAGKQVGVIPVGVAPWGAVIAPDGKHVYVSNWGGRRSRAGDKTEDSGGTPVVVDEHGVASSGTVGVIDVDQSKMVAEIPVGLHPNAMVLSPDGSKLYVANANSDSVSVIDTAANKVVGTIDVKPDDKLPWGSSPDALAMSADGKTLFVAVGGNNAVAVVDLGSGQVRGFVPAGWFPGAVATDGANLFVANVKGIGSRDPAAKGEWSSHSYWGTVTKVAVPDEQTLATYTKQVREDALVPQALRAWERAQAGVKPVPVPQRVGEPSTIEHVVYVIKENRTYDQVLGDIGRGNSDPKLCTFGREVTPNHHALAEQFVLLDNFYCNGVLSADGHAWATEGYAVDYLEKSFGAWVRSYPFPGDDALAVPPTGYLWDNALTHGLSFRNYGEFSTTEVKPRGTGRQVYEDYLNGGPHKYKYTNSMALDPLRAYSNPASSGWNLRIPDQQRADVFLKELKEWEAKGTFPNLTILYLPNDHTSGTSPGNPTPPAMVADNDLALGRVIEGISHSKFWPTTAVFVIEDDPQNGFDHVDGHRSLCLVASPYTKRRAVVSKFYNQTSVLHTMEVILGLPPMNQMDAMAPVMRDVFTDKADPTPYTALKNNIPLTQTNPAKAELTGRQLEMAELSEHQDFDEPDRANEDALNRVLWYARMGWDSHYPQEWAGAHGRGLKKLGLKIDGTVRDGDDD